MSREKSGGPEIPACDRVPQIDVSAAIKTAISVLQQLDERGDMTRPELNAWQSLSKEFCGSERVEDLRAFIMKLQSQKDAKKHLEDTLMGMNPLTIPEGAHEPEGAHTRPAYVIPSNEELLGQSLWESAEEREQREARVRRSEAPTREESVVAAMNPDNPA